MAEMYELDKGVLRKSRDNGKCPCKLEDIKCPCDDFLERDECICGAYKKVVK